ncbi:MAG: hypothetical protein ACI30A_07210 [Paludibacteraceae bacterium]
MKKVFFMMICMAPVMVACNVRSAQDKQSENVVEDSIATTMEGNAVAAENSADAEAVMSATEPTEEEIAPAEPAKASGSSASASSSSNGRYGNDAGSYNHSGDYGSSSSDREKSDLEKLREHSPNDNYLLGFDEDVDDVHDMEIYMEDY